MQFSVFPSFSLSTTFLTSSLIIILYCVLFTLLVIREHGKDYSALSTALQNKSIGQCRNFFTNYKRKLNLPRIIADYEVRTVSSD